MAADFISRAQARANGLTKYFTGKPCKNHHIVERRVANGTCDLCYRNSERIYRDKNRDKFRAKWRRASAKQTIVRPDAVRAKQTKWLAANKDKKKSQIKRWKAANPERLRIQEARQRLKYPEKFRTKNRRYKTENAERLAPINRARVRQWQKDNPEGVLKNIHARRARKKSASGSHTADQIIELLHRQNHRCAGCGISIKQKRHLDHVMPLSRGGSNSIENLQWLCQPCNNKKHAKDPIEWAQENGRLL